MDIRTHCRTCQVEIFVTVEKYIMLYFKSQPKENQSSENARKFLNKHYKSFRKEIVEIGVDTLYSCEFSKEAQQVVQENYRLAVAQLFIKIVFVSNKSGY